MSDETTALDELRRRARAGDRRALQELRDRGFFRKAAAPAHRSYPLSHAQRRMWILAESAEAGSAYHLPRAVMIEGPLDAPALGRAFQAIVARHESLRTTFERVDGEPRQVVHPEIGFRVEMEDLRGRPDPLAETRSIAAADARRPFDLETGPLLRVRLLRTGEAQHVLVFNVHHIVCDGWSLDVVVRELAAFYGASVRGEEPPLPALTIHYKDFAVWQNERLRTPEARAHRRYWQRKLAGPIPVLDLPTDWPRPDAPAWAGRTLVVDLGAAIRDGLARLGGAHRASLFTVLVALVKVLLARTTGQEEIVVGAPVAGRDHPDLEDQVGMYANAVAIRDRVPLDLPFTAFLDRVRRTCEEAFEHQETPFDQLVTDLGLDRDPGRSPLFDVMVGLLNTEREDLRLGDLRLTGFEIGTGLAPHDLVLYFAESGGALHLETTYKTDLFEEATVRRMQDGLRRLAESAIADPAQTLGALDDGEEQAPAEAPRPVSIDGRPLDAGDLASRIIEGAGLADAAVLARAAGDGRGAITAFLVPADGTAPDRLVERARGAVPDVQAHVVFVPVSSIPRLPSGRPNVRALERCAGSEDAAEAEQEVPPLHVWDLVPDQAATAPAGQVRAAAGATSREAPAEPATWNDPPALADGGALEGFEGAPATLAAALVHAAETTSEPRLVFLGDDGTEWRRTYDDLLAEARRILGGLRRRGFGAGERVVLLLPRNEDVLPGFWASVLGGLVPVVAAVPLHFEGSNRAVDHLGHLWRLLERPLFLTTRVLSGPVLSLRRLFDVDPARVAAIEDLRESDPAEALHEARRDETAFFTLTSGSTGAPKCVMLSHENILARARGTNLLSGHARSDVILNWLPFDHIGSLSDWHVRCVDLACTAVYATKESALGDPLNWLRLIDRHRATHSWAPNFAYALVNDAMRSRASDIERWDLSCVEGLLSAGEAVAREAVETFLERLAPYGLRPTAIRPAFGMAEMGSGVTYALGTGRGPLGTEEAPVRFHRVDRASLAGRLREAPDDPAAAVFADLGPPIPGVALRIVDEAGRLLPEGRIGRLHVRGEAVAKGYYRDPEATRAVFRDDGWFETGDLAFLAGGRLALTGRARESIIVSGANYSSTEIESVVETIDGVEVSYVAAAAARGPGDAEERLAVFFAPREDGDERLRALVPAIREAVAGRIGIRPDYVVPVAKDEIPKTAIGKIQRARLVDRLETGGFADAVRRADLLAATERTIPDWFARKVWRRCEAGPNGPLRGGAVVIADHLGVGELLARGLEARGIRCALVPPGGACDPGPLRDARYVIHLRGLDGAAGDGPPGDFDGLGGLLPLGRALAARAELPGGDAPPVRLLVAARGTEVVGADDPVIGDRPAWPGFVASLGQEMSWLEARITDLPPADAAVNAERCLAELLRAGGDAISAWRGGKRYVPRLARAALAEEAPGPAPFRKGALYLVAGGLGGVGRLVTRHLRDRCGARLLLIGRTAEAERRDEVRALGGQDVVLYRQADVTDLDALRVAVDAAETAWGTALAGVLHLAGVIAERPVVEETPESFRAVLRPKTLGAWTLARLAEERCGRADGLFVSFSSVNGLLGGARAAAYAAANAYLDTLTDHVRGRSRLRCWNLAWSMWDDTGISRGFALKDVTRAMGFHVMRPEAATISFDAALRRRPGHLLIGLDPTSPSFRHRFDEPARVVRARPAEGSRSTRVPPRSDLERRLARIWEDLLGVSGVGVHDHFIRLGGHSLRATQMVARVQKELDARLSLQDVFRAPTIAGLAALIEPGARRLEPIEPVPPAPHYPVSHAQRRLWVIGRMGIDRAAYNIPGASLLEGDLDPEAFRIALEALVRRHESLRTVFAEIDGAPRQIVRDAVDVALVLVDLRAEADADGAARRLVDQEAARPFDLETGPLLRVSLVRLAERRWVLLFNVHHIVSDGWSLDVMVRDLLALYAAVREGRGDPLPPLRLQYRDFAAWQDRVLAGEEARPHRAYWLERMSGELPVLDLPADGPRPSVRSFRGGLVEFTLDARTAAGVRTLAERHDATMFMTWLALVRTLIYRYAGAADAIVGTPVAGREHPDLAAQVGFFVNMLPLRTEVTGALTFEEVLDRAQAATAEALAHQVYPYDRLVEELALRRDMGRNPLFDVVLSVREREAPGSFAGVVASPFGIQARSSKFDLTVFLAEGEGGAWEGALEYDADLFQRERIDRLAESFRTLVASALRDPRAPIRDLEILPEAERRLVLEAFPAAPTLYPRDRTVASIFEEEAARGPERPAVECGDAQLTYRALNARANGLARWLRESGGIRPEEPVGVLLEGSEWTPVALLGILKAGGAYLPIEPAYPPDRIAFILEDTGCRFVLADAALAASHAPRHPGVTFVDVRATAAPAEENPTPVGSGGSPAYVMYTSGSTGQPKGSVIEQRAIARLVLGARYLQLGESDRVLLTGSLAFDASTFEIWGPLLNGGSVVFPERRAILDAAALRDLIRRHGVTTMWFTSSLFNQLVEADVRIFGGLRHLLVGGERLSPPHVNRVRQAFPRLVMINGYGPTENTTFTACHRIEGACDGDVPIGRPISNTTVHILDRDLRAVPVGVPGEICAGGDGLARGYLNRPELTRERFVPHPYRPGERLYRTGDLGRWRPDGTIEILGRLDEQVKIRGYRVEPGEIESCLREHPLVLDAAVVARLTSSGTCELVAYVAAPPETSIPEVRAHLRAALPEHMVPAHLVRLERMPLNANGKVDRKALPAPEGHLDSGRGATEETPPRSEAEALLAGIWAEILGRPRVGLHDNYFELGGDSIRAIQVATRLRKAGFMTEVRDVFAWPTVAELGPRLRRATAGAPARPGAVAGPVPLTAIQRWFLETHRGRIHHFNQAVLLRPRRPLDDALLGAVLSRLQERHDALRLAVRRAGDEVVAEILPPDLPVRFDVSDLRGEVDPESALVARLDAWHRDIDLDRGPLFRAALVRLRDGERLWLAAHHLAVDGVSWRILLDDLEIGYGQAERGEPIDLGTPTATFRDRAEETERFRTSEELRAEVSYWADLEPPAPEVPEHRYGDAETVHAELSTAETAALLGESHRAYGTEINDLLLVALGRALGASDGRERTVVALEGHGRERLREDLDLTRTVGWFTSIFPFALDTSGHDLRDQIRRVKESLRLVPRRGVGYGILRHMTAAPGGVRPTLGGAATAAPAISFNYLGQFDRAGGEGLFEFAGEASGRAISPDLSRPHELDVVCLVSGGRMRMTLTFHRGRREEAQALLGRFAEELGRVVAHCHGRQPERTPSDFSSPAFTLSAYDDFLARRGWRPAEVEDVVRPTPMQEGLLLQSLVDPASRAYLVQMAFTLRGPLDPDRFERAWTAVARRHPILRSAFAHEDVPRPLQIVLRDRRPEFAWTDPGGTASAQQEERIREERRRDLDRGFDFERESLMRFRAFRIDDERWRVVWSYHHVLLDGWSLGIVLRDFGRAYAALAAGRAPDLPPAPHPAGLVRWFERRDVEGAAWWWRRHLEGYEAAAVLPGARTPGAGERPDLRETIVELDAATTARLRENAGRCGATTATIAHAAWSLVLARYNRTEDVVFGTIVSGRSPDLDGAEETVGTLINAVPVRVRPRADATIAELVQSLQADLLAAEPFHHLPLAEVLAVSPLGRGLLTHLLVVENYPADVQVAATPLAGGLEIEDVEAHDRTHYDFDLTLVPGDRLLIKLEFDARVHTPGQMERTAAHYLAVLRAFAGDTARRLAEIEIMPAEEREMVLRTFQPRPAEPSGPTVVDLFEAQVARAPGQVAIERQWHRVTYRQLADRVRALAETLREACGVRRGDLVAVLQERSESLPATLLAVLRAGAAYVPIDPGYPEARVRFMLEDSECRVVVADERSARHLAGFTLVGRSEDVTFHVAPSARETAAGDDGATGPEDAAYVIYTSGSTGRPKGVVIPHRALVSQVEWFVRAFDIGPSDRFLQKTPLSFDVSVEEIYGPLLAGGCIVVAKPDAHVDPDYLREAVAGEGITLLDLVPAQLAMVNEAGGLPARSALRHVFLGGEALDAALLARLPEGAGFSVHNLYGPSETCVNAAAWTWDGRLGGPIPIGRPVTNTRIYVLGPDLAPLPLGVPGEICIAGRNLGLQYLRRPELTAERFVESPSLPGERLYRTGDLGRWREDGLLEFLGRLDEQVKIRGHRIECGEVEVALRAHPAVREALVMACPAAGGNELVAFVVTGPGGVEAPSAGDLSFFLAATLPEPMVPLRFVRLDRIPLAPSGKVDRRVLVAAAGTATETGPEGDLPRDARERAIAAIWGEVLGRERIGVGESFFEIGGHSLKAMQIVSRIHHDLGVKLALREFFLHPTVAAQAALVAPGLRSADDGIEPAPPREDYALSHAQQRLWLLHHIPGGETAYNMPCAFTLEGADVDAEALGRAFGALVERHEALRTAFVVVDGEPRQRILPRVDVAIRRVDLRDAPDAEARARALAEEEARAPFDLSRPPLLRVTVVRMPGERTRHLVLLTMHHIVGDGWSGVVLEREIEVLYEAFRAGRPSPLPPLRIQYKDFSEWQNRRGFAEEESWWLSHLAGVPERIGLPYDVPPAEERDFRGAVEEHVLDAATTAGLRALAAARGMTLAHGVLALFQLALYRLTGQDDLCVGMSVANRSHPDLERLIGFFVNILPIRTRLSEAMDLDALLDQVARIATEALDRQDYPFDLLVRRLCPARVANRQPLLNVVFAFQNFADVEVDVGGRPAGASAARATGAEGTGEAGSFDFTFGTSKFDLTLFVADEGPTLRLILEYDTALFRAESARSHLGLIARFARAAASRHGAKAGS